MKPNKLIGALALAALGATTAHAQAAPSLPPLQNAAITASYNGDPAGMLGLDGGFAAGSNTTGLDPTDSGVEFLTADALFAFDFSASGALTVYANSAIPAGAYGMRFDFGSTLANPISAFTFVGADGANGVPVLSVIDAHTIGLDLSGIQWTQDYGTLTGQLTFAAPVPEPSGTAMLLVGLAGLGFVARRRQQRR